MTQEMMIMAAILVAVILLTFIGILSRYRKCKSDEVLVVYGKTGNDKKSAKLYHGGAAFVWPIIQGYEFLSMKPMQIDCNVDRCLVCTEYSCGCTHHHHRSHQYRPRSDAKCSRTYVGIDNG